MTPKNIIEETESVSPETLPLGGASCSPLLSSTEGKKMAGVIVSIQSPDPMTDQPFGGQVASSIDSSADLDQLFRYVKEVALNFRPKLVVKESVQIVITLTVRDYRELAMRHCAAVDLLKRGKDALPCVGQRLEPREEIDRDHVVPSRDSIDGIGINIGVANGIGHSLANVRCGGTAAQDS